MIRYDGKYALGKVVKRRVPLTDFGGYDPDDADRSLPKSMCDEAFNFAFDRGRLTDGVSFSPFRQTLDDGSAQALPVPQTQFGEYELFAGKLKIDGKTRDVLFASESQRLSYLVLGDENATWQTKTDMSPGTFVSAVGYVFEDDDLMLFAGRGAGVYILSGSNGGQTVANALPIRDIRTYRERVFAVVDRERPCVWFSDAFDPYDWSVSLDAGGYIYTDGSAGKVLAIVPMSDFLFVVCEYGPVPPDRILRSKLVHAQEDILGHRAYLRKERGRVRRQPCVRRRRRSVRKRRLWGAQAHIEGGQIACGRKGRVRGLLARQISCLLRRRQVRARRRRRRNVRARPRQRKYRRVERA